MSNILNYIKCLDNNSKIFIFISLLVTLYNIYIISELPQELAKIFNHSYIKLLLIIITCYLIYKNQLLGLSLSVIILLTLQALITLDNEINNNKINKVELSFPLTENKQYDDLDDIPLSPKRSDLIKCSMDKLNHHTEMMHKANTENNTELVDFHNNEINKQNLKIDCIIKEKQFLLNAENAKISGDLKTSSDLMLEAQKNNIKFVSLENSEKLKEKAVEAHKNGNIDESTKLNELADIEETRVYLIITADNKMIESNNARTNGNVDHADKCMKEVNDLYTKLYDLNNNSQKNTVKSQEKDDVLSSENKDDNISGFDDNNYSPNKYATY